MREARERWGELVGALGFAPARQAALILKGQYWLERVTGRPDERGGGSRERQRRLFWHFTEHGWPPESSQRQRASLCLVDKRTYGRWLLRPPPKPKCPVDRLETPHSNVEVAS